MNFRPTSAAVLAFLSAIALSACRAPAEPAPQPEDAQTMHDDPWTEKVRKLGLPTDPKSHYTVDPAGIIRRSNFALGADHESKKIAEIGMKPEPGYNYYIDDEGDVSRHADGNLTRVLLPDGEKSTKLVDELRSVFCSVVIASADDAPHPETRFTVVALGNSSVGHARKMLEKIPAYPGKIFVLDSKEDSGLSERGVAFPSRETLLEAITGAKREEAEALKRKIRGAFTTAEYPGDANLRSSSEGDEPYLLEAEFKGKTDWRVLDPGFIDRAPDGYGSSLSFFSPEAYRFYLPAYLLADLDDALERNDPVFSLTHGLTDNAKTERVNPRRYGDQTWFEATSPKRSLFSAEEADAIRAYLRFQSKEKYASRVDIEQALRNFWNRRSGDG